MEQPPSPQSIRQLLSRHDTDIRQITHIASSSRAWVYKADYQNRKIVVKVYNLARSAKYKKRCGKSAAAFEYSRNKKFYSNALLQKYTVEPIGYFATECYSIFLQEFVDGIVLQEFIKQHRYIPAEVLQVAYMIVPEAAKIGLFDLDIHKGNIQIVPSKKGWIPILYDFNMMPQCFSHPLFALAHAYGCYNRNRRDYINLNDWSDYACKIGCAEKDIPSGRL